MRAIQRYFISGADISKSHGKNFLKSGVSSGQPSVASGQRPDENQVSKIFSSCSHRCAPQVCQFFSGISADTTMSLSLPTSCAALQFLQYHTGMRCPHQSDREIDQSCILESQSDNAVWYCSGTNCISLIRRSAFCASGCIFKNHSSEISGSMVVPHRSHTATLCVYSSSLTKIPFSLSSPNIASRASKTFIPAYFPAASVILPSL